MPEIKYQKIELHSTDDLAKDYEIIEYEKETVEKLMIENQIEFAMEIERKKELPIISRKQNIVYVLMLIVKKDDLDNVIDFLVKDGNFGYFVYLDSTYDPNEEKEEIENQDNENLEFIEKLNGAIEDAKDDPIKMYGEKEIENDENLEDYKFKTKPIDYKTFPIFIMKLFLSAAYMFVLIPELIGIIYGIQDAEYEIATAMFVLVVIETPIFVWLYRILNKKKK